MKRLWGVRHARWLWLSWRVRLWTEQMAQIGLGFDYPNQSDIDHLNAIWRGEQ